MATGITKRFELYAALMEELKVRIECIEQALAGRTGFPPPIVREFCYLQLRLLSELIALSCLVAHGDIAGLQSHKSGRAWSADEILKRLTELRPHFYPITVKQTKAEKEEKGVNYHLTPVEPSPLPKDEVLKLYAKTHPHLHRGNLRKLLSAKTPLEMEINAPEIRQWVGKFRLLLGTHMIALNEENVIVCSMKDEKGNVQVAVTRKKLAKG
ncbi:hypothetical protein [Hyphomicrobium sp. NDB2Meth4]|uniref:hypothetical protein n=1 Tax=Hyphomicrobium sp. NDB2Meth4 TaxID=1892846 RepID=UPI0009314E09|nr:hypothetical protein [Hyphomicrobium sp. NDB2Meth4]